MEYQIFPLKYRPQTFDDVVGQPHIIQTLKKEIKYGRIASAYLFAGPRGTGKTTTARIVAKALNCIKGLTSDPCNSCAQCQEIQNGNSLDVLEIDGASNRGIDEVRQLRERVKYAPSRGKYKVYIIDEVHMLTEPAFNALLKTIEEPPRHVVFIFATTAPYKLPLTILSRCQRFNFRKISPITISERIKAIAKVESVEIDASACALIAQFVDGSLRDAISIFDQLIPYAEDKIKAGDVQILLGLPPQTVFFELTDAIIKRDALAILTLTRTTVSQGVAPVELISGLINHLQTMFLIKTGVSPVTTSDRYASQAELLDISHLLNIINFLFDTEKNIRNALSQEIYLEQALVRVSICKQLPIKSLLDQLVQEEVIPIEGVIGGKEKIEERETEVIQDVQKLWKILPQKLKKPSLEGILVHVTPIELANGKLLVRCKSEFSKTKIEENLGLIEEELTKMANRPINIVFEITKVRKGLVEDPIVQSAIKIFNAELVQPHPQLYEG